MAFRGFQWGVCWCGSVVLDTLFFALVAVSVPALLGVVLDSLGTV